MLRSVEADESLTIKSLPEPQAGQLGLAGSSDYGEALAVEGVQGLPRLQHHKIGYVNDVVDRANAGLLQALLQPGGRGGHLQTIQGRDTEKTTSLNCSQVACGKWQRLACGGGGRGLDMGLAAHQSRNLPGNALH